MSGYEVEHNISPEEAKTSNEPRRRPDLSTFYSALEQLDTSDAAHARHNPHAHPTPTDVIALFSMFRDALIVMGADQAGGDPADNPMFEQLQAFIDNPPKEINGVPDSFIEGLDRVPKKDLKKDDECAICRLPFLDDPYPLVVELPCDAGHRFDMDCIRPWLKLNSTCPLDRKDFSKKKAPPPLPDDEEEEWDDQFG
ncbi:Zinc finger RING-type protein [Lasiodiplodia theobromae]|uniref:Zinc finger RING-type protein n=1 Tax=Lasiodiplodia theobromae TaxID=45133 RepID=UPI0015C3DEE5|nr:Zinc finger RING-type protein [Lasiodiplodia theobromae]KAF4543264.1 Zinc finger RING-type protein [Lasiodiplodia theobromae]